MAENETEPMAIKSSILLKSVGEKKFVDLALKDSFDVIITDPVLLVKNLTGTVAVREEYMPEGDGD